jgi:hypothetical protein
LRVGLTFARIDSTVVAPIPLPASAARCTSGRIHASPGRRTGPVGPDLAEVRSRTDFQVDIVAERAAKRFTELIEQGIEIQRSGVVSQGSTRANPLEVEGLVK